jgi:c-di-GMP-binding flagellar brake protein YcgR
MSPVAPTPLVAADIARGDGRFDVHSRLDIVSTMRALADRHTLVTAYGARPGDFIVSAVLGVYPDDDLLVLDFGADRPTTERVLGAGEVRVVTQLDHIRIQFSTEAADTIEYEGAPAFLARIPEVMQRLQRREYYRVRIPLSSPLRIAVTPNPENPDVVVPLRVLDVSCGGIALTDVPIGLGAAVGNVYRGCRIALPGLGAISVDFRVVRVVRDETKPGTCLVAGPFVDLPAPAMMLLQRYINRLERERLAAS